MENHYELKNFAGPFSEQYQKQEMTLMVIICGYKRIVERYGGAEMGPTNAYN